MAKEEKQKLSKEEKKQAKLDAKQEKADTKKEELVSEIDKIRTQILEEKDEKQKKKLRRQRDDLTAQYEGIKHSKDGMTIPMARKTKKIVNSVIAVIVVIALLFAYIGTGVCRHGLFSSFGVPQSTLTAFTLTDGKGKSHNIKVSTYNYYFAMKYNTLQNQKKQYEQYGIDLSTANLNVDFDKKLSKQTVKNDDGKTVTWAEYIQEQVIDSIKSTYLYYYEAVAANKGKEPSITDDQKSELKDTIKEYNDSAKKYGYTLSGYLTAAMGKGVTEEVFRREAKISYIAENYQSDYKNELNSKKYSNEKYEEYKKDNYDDLKSVDVKMFECDSEDDAKAFAKALKADGSNFADLASKYSSSDWDKEHNKDAVETTYKDITPATLKNLSYAIATADEKNGKKYSGLDWLYAKSRKAGDIKQYSTTVVYVLKPVYFSNQKTVNVRHILIKPETSSSSSSTSSTSDATTATSKQWKAAQKKADKILKEFNDGKKTEEAFADLAKENSEDSNKDDGGLYENVTPHQMVNTFDAWCFDSSRKAGDTAIVQTKYGYHIMYFSGYGDLKVWEYTAQQSLASKDSKDTQKELEDSYKIKTNWLGSRFFEKDTDIDS